MRTIIRQCTETILQSQGIDISKYEISFLESSLQKRMNENGCDSAEEYCAILERDRKECTAFVDALQISYSLFFRNPLTCAVLERMVLPAVALQRTSSRRHEIRVWAAACAGGQEAYSLAMLLEELVAGKEKLAYRIFATDVSEAQVQEAMRGEYAAAALNNVNLKRAGRWFRREGDRYAVLPELKKNIEFSTFDLFRDGIGCPSASIFGDFDLVVCANLLFYYQEPFRATILAKIGHCLTAGGYLVTGETERDIIKRYHYQELFPPSAIFKRNTP
ncbi:MAG: protein-glutamate O-methyltransferase CheR [Geobacteraceae bacterium]|nr:protein-glutamate O-methyltransferase CheR [Geobacteraceae bacterium]